METSSINSQLTMTAFTEVPVERICQNVNRKFDMLGAANDVVHPADETFIAFRQILSWVFLTKTAKCQLAALTHTFTLR